MKKRYQINVVLSEEEDKMVNDLRDKYAINVSGCFKLLLKSYWEQLKTKEVKLDTQI